MDFSEARSLERQFISFLIYLFSFVQQVILHLQLKVASEPTALVTLSRMANYVGDWAGVQKSSQALQPLYPFFITLVPVEEVTIDSFSHKTYFFKSPLQQKTTNTASYLYCTIIFIHILTFLDKLYFVLLESLCKFKNTFMKH